MNKAILDSNFITITGEVISEPVVHHVAYGETFYVTTVRTMRLSDNFDLIPVLVSEKLAKLKLGDFVTIDGQVRTYNEYTTSKRKLNIFVFSTDVEYVSREIGLKSCECNNKVSLQGFLCKSPNYRTTPFGREITDMLIAVNRSFKKSDYIPVITWGRNAKYARSFDVGQNVEATGRFQSREYIKKLEDGTVEKRVAYEISILNLTAL